MVPKGVERVESSWITGTEVLVRVREFWSGTLDGVIWKSPGGGAGVGCLRLRLCRERVRVLVVSGVCSGHGGRARCLRRRGPSAEEAGHRNSHLCALGNAPDVPNGEDRKA